MLRPGDPAAEAGDVAQQPRPDQEEGTASARRRRQGLRVFRRQRILGGVRERRPLVHQHQEPAQAARAGDDAEAQENADGHLLDVRPEMVRKPGDVRRPEHRSRAITLGATMPAGTA